MHILFRNLALLFIFFSISFTYSQQRPSIFVDCQMRCDFTYLKQEIQFVNYALNQQETDIYILATNQRTGGGGRQVQLVYKGGERFPGQTDTLLFNVDPNATDAIRREQFVREVKRGLLPFLLQTDLFETIAYDFPKESLSTNMDSAQQARDPWNYWVFNVGGSGSFDGEQRFREVELTGRVYANRVTNQHKVQLSARYNYEKSTFTLTDGEEFSSLIIRYSARAEYVKSIGPRWSVGFQSRAGSSTFGNTDLDATFRPAVEFNIFPYEEAQTKRFSFMYSIGPQFYDYTDTTVYNKMTETVLRHGIEMEFNITQQWGNIRLDFGVQQYLHNPNLYSTYLNPDLEWQIYKGLRIDIGGYVSLVRDRINIAKSDISDEDILLQIKQLDTSFAYFSYIGLNYRFGSSFNNFVNPRF